MTEHVLSLAEIRARAEIALNPAPGSEPAPMGLVMKLKPSPAANANRSRQKAAIWAGARQPKRSRSKSPKQRKAAHPFFDMPAERMMELHAQHGSWDAVARADGRCGGTTVKRRAKELGLTPPPYHKRRQFPVGTMTVDEMMAAHAQHGSWSAFARHLGCNPWLVTTRAVELGLKPKPATSELDRETLEKTLAEFGSWRAVAKHLQRCERTVTKAARKFGLRTSWPRFSDEEVLAAYDQAGGARGAAELLGVSYNGQFLKRLKTLLEARG